MEILKGYQKKFLKGLAHGLKPVVFVGQKGLSGNLIGSIQDALDTHELIKVKFIEFKEKQQKAGMADTIEAETGCRLVGIIGNQESVSAPFGVLKSGSSSLQERSFGPLSSKCKQSLSGPSHRAERSSSEALLKHSAPKV